MGAKGGKVSKREIERMVKLYRELGSYAKVAARVRRNPSTVSKYVQQYEIAQLTKQYLALQGIITKGDILL